MIYTTITIISIEFRLEQLCVVIMCTTLHKEKKEKRKKREREGVHLPQQFVNHYFYFIVYHII